VGNTTAALQHVMFVAAIWGYLVSWLNEVIKQDSLPTWANTLIADGLVIGSSALVTWQAAPSFTWAAFGHAAFGAFAAAVINHSLFLKPTGVGDKLQTLTSFKKNV
jgi:hypothetical protein